MAYEAVIFDIGGVLETNPSTGWERRWAQRLGLAPSELEQRLDSACRGGQLGTRDLTEVERRAAAALKLDDAQLSRLMADLWAEYVGTLNDEVARFFASLRPRYRTGILSNSFVGARERERDAYAFEDMCDAVVYSHEEGVEKPDPRAYAIVCQRLGVAPSRALFLDDVAANVEGARRVGMTAIQFLDTRQAITEVSRRLG
jgi:epoxide hydrolase-like predicted phosphatase